MAFPITELKNTFGHEISKQVIENMDANFILRWLDQPEFFHSPIDMLSAGFVWEETPQGYDYWLEITGNYSMENN
jgi:hypothetical protein